ncbi:hypothetical protein Pcinc_036921 [Petrolisthes cinctipes]|uniref:Peptidase M24 domain-containing protein n=1 Tax=Petrolisthes cinctipes TaxID=88211 RepID=A0AAE1BTR8_PETCI|nr:hypothetical protein Pcinc_036921 [Petrolisthes cinctipes]
MITVSYFNLYQAVKGLPETPSEGKWLNKTLEISSIVGADPHLIEEEVWKELTRELQTEGHSLVPITHNLIDVLWAGGRPQRPANLVLPLEIKYTGCSTQEKLIRLRENLQEENVFMIVLTALDEVAYLYNLRGSDIEYNPVFFSYGVVTMTEAVVFVNNTQLTTQTNEALNEANINVKPYQDLERYITQQLDVNTGKVWISNHSSHAVTQLVPRERRLTKLSPVALMKAVKNEVEIKGMEACHIRDATALCRYFAWLEKEASKGTQTEISAAEQLHKYRQELDEFVGLSFSTISSEIYLCDSGAQYRDGTTDVTRTVHFGTPTDFERECFTRVLKGLINVATCVFPSKIKGNCLDSLARVCLWEVGLDYGHGTGHGIGMYLNVHEGPMGVSWRSYPDDPGLQLGMFLSDEPGYYEDGKFGIRIEISLGW